MFSLTNEQEDEGAQGIADIDNDQLRESNDHNNGIKSEETDVEKGTNVTTSTEMSRLSSSKVRFSLTNEQEDEGAKGIADIDNDKLRDSNDLIISTKSENTDVEKETNLNSSDGQETEIIDQTFHLPAGFLQRSPSAITIRNMTKHKRYNTYPNLQKEFDKEKQMREYSTQASAPVRADPYLNNSADTNILEHDSLSLPLLNRNDETDAYLKPLSLEQHVVDVSEEEFFDAVESLDSVGHNEENDENKSISEGHVTNKSLCMECVKPLQVNSKEDVQAGDHLAYPGRIYDHHAIVVDVYPYTATDDEIEIEIVHATNTATKATFASFQPFGNKARLKKVKVRVNFKDKKVVVYKYSSKIEIFPPHIIAERAKSEANADSKGGKGQFKYNLFKNNCEHFATWCVTGGKRSLQERKFSMVFWMFLSSGFQGISDENERNEKEFEKEMLCLSCYETNKRVLDVEKRQILQKTDVKIGDIITYSYYNLWHNAVVLDVNGMKDNYTTCDIAHYAYCGPFKHHTIVKEKLLIPFDGSIKVIIYPSNFNTYTAHEVVERAKTRLNEQEFAYFSNDSSQFARWCKLKLYK
ncbi:uncharacterized protein LOC134707081 [Mytilus trossulus]|uniref:uncharacterized protein LOC134707081 n=1 Tax=Mytilus trossulus TaxID=6551 RepID=UPI003004197C